MQGVPALARLRKIIVWLAATPALAAQLAYAQADLGPRTPVEGGAIIMPEHAPPPKKMPAPDRSRQQAPPERKESRPPPPPPANTSGQADCKGDAAHCRQDSAR